MKPIRHMTLAEYKENIVPKVMELKKILRKNYMKSVEYSGLRYLALPEYIEYNVERSRGEKYFDEAYEIAEAKKAWFHFKLKEEPIPTKLHAEYKAIYNEICPLYINQRYADLSKIHKDHKAEVRLAMEKVYIEELKNEIITFEQLEAVCDSVGVRIPKRVYDLKENIAMGMYKREFVKANKEFLATIEKFLTPYREELKSMKRDQLMRWAEQYENESTVSLHKYWTNRSSSGIYAEMSNLYHHSYVKRADDFEKLLEEKCEYYAETYIRTFVMRLEEKVNVVNLNWGVPKIEFSTDCLFRGGQLNVSFKLTYENGEIITGESKVIIAGGYIQCLHQRYLFHFWHSGNNVSLEQMDQLK